MKFFHTHCILFYFSKKMTILIFCEIKFIIVYINTYNALLHVVEKNDFLYKMRKKTKSE